MGYCPGADSYRVDHNPNVDDAHGLLPAHTSGHNGHIAVHLWMENVKDEKSLIGLKVLQPEQSIFLCVEYFYRGPEF